MQDNKKVLNSSCLKLNSTCQQVAVETAIGSNLSKETDALINCTVGCSDFDFFSHFEV